MTDFDPPIASFDEAMSAMRKICFRIEGGCPLRTLEFDRFAGIAGAKEEGISHQIFVALRRRKMLAIL